jgi:hypothetical protein
LNEANGLLGNRWVEDHIYEPVSHNLDYELIQGSEGYSARISTYGIVRHPQYAGFVLVMTGFLLMWPTLLTLAMYPILLVVYVNLAKQEEKQVRTELGEEYDEYARNVPAFIPKLPKQASNKKYVNH